MHTPHHINPKLWAEIRKGNADSFKVVYQSCYKDLYAFGFRVCANKEQVKDTIHEMFCEIWDKRHQLNEVNNISAYLKTYLKRKLLKETVTHFIAEESELKKENQLKEHSYEDLLIQSQTTDSQKFKIAEALKHLSPSQKEIITLKFFDELNYQQIAVLLNIKARTVYNQVYKSLLTLKEHLK